MTDLPRPDVQVTSRELDGGNVEIDVTISRGNQSRSYTGVGNSSHRDGAYKDALDKILGDRYSGEWLPSGTTPKK